MNGNKTQMDTKTIETKLLENPNITAKQAHITLFYNHYQNEEKFPPTLKKFIEMYYEQCDYPKLVADFAHYQQSLKTPIDLRHSLWVTHIRQFLKTKMIYPDGQVFIVKNLPEKEILRLVDYLGYEIGLGVGHGNDKLIDIYKQYKHLF